MVEAQGPRTVGQWLLLGDTEAAFRALERRRGQALLQLRRQRSGGPEEGQGGDSLSDVRAALDPGTLLLAFAVEDDATHVFAIDQAKGLSKSHSLAIGAEALAAEVDNLLAAVGGARHEGTQHFDRFQELARWFYRELLSPLDGPIEDSQRLLIVPDGALHRLPFSCLIRESERAPRGEQYLIEWKSLFSVVSARFYADLKSEPRSPIHRYSRLVAFGDAEYGVAMTDGPLPSPLTSPGRIGGERHGRQALPGSGREVRAIAGYFDNHRLFLGKDATKDNLWDLEAGVDILHLSTHGQRFPEGTRQAALFLSPRRQGGDAIPDSGRLEVGEIVAGHVPPARLVVLSACDSALGPDRDDGASLGLGWAFLANGARSVVTSLWRIDDHRTADLMDRFYASLAAGESPADALRSAQLDLIQGYGDDASAPPFWAAFQVQGDWR